MKRKLLSVVALVSILAMLFSVAAAPANVTGLTFLGVHFQGSKGLVFKFAISGDVGKESFDGYVNFSGKQYNLDCNVSDDGKTLVCVGGDGINKLGGNTVYGTVNGFPFTAQLPNAVCSWYIVGATYEYGEETWDYYYWVDPESLEWLLSSLPEWGEKENFVECQTTLSPWLWDWYR